MKNCNGGRQFYHRDEVEISIVESQRSSLLHSLFCTLHQNKHYIPHATKHYIPHATNYIPHATNYICVYDAIRN